MARAEILRGILIYSARKAWEKEICCRDAAQYVEPLQRQRKDLEIALAREDDGEEAAVRGDSEFAKCDAVKDGLRSLLENGDFFAGWLREKRRNFDPDNVPGFSFGGTLEEDAVFVGSPVENAEAHAKADKVIRNGEVAHFENFAVDEIGDLFATG